MVKSVIPGMEAAFVDLGTDKDGFLYVSDYTETPFDFEFGEDEETKKTQDFNKKVKIEDLLKVGQEVIVQVVKEGIRSKGPRLTTKYSLPGRYLVLMPGDTRVGISRRIVDTDERRRLKTILKKIHKKDDGGVIVRTVGEGKDFKEFQRDLKYLKKIWKKIQHKIRTKKAPCLVHEEMGLIERIVRDFFTEETEKIIVDNKQVLKNVKRFMRYYLPKHRVKIELFRDKGALFEKFNIENDIEKAFQKRVRLKSGGHIVIEQTEGLVAIDVNTGKFVGKKRLEETVFKTNCEASKEIARQLRLRDLGGIIIIDFIDMSEKENRKKVYRIFEDAVSRDRAKTNILRISELGLVEMTRQRVRPSLESAVFDTCPYCSGKGIVKSVTTMSIQSIKKIKKMLTGTAKRVLNVSVHPDVADHLLNQNKKALRKLEKQFKSEIIVISDPSSHIEDINMTFQE